jgi:hypothetical protein
MNVFEHVLLQLNESSFIKKNIITHHSNSDNIAVIVDPRFNHIIESVIRNYMYFLNKKGWNLLIYSHNTHEKIIKEKFPNSLFKSIDEKYIVYDHEEMPQLTIDKYNELFMSKEFWESIPSNNILIFQADCIMFRDFIPIFMDYDYVGANYYMDVSPLYGGLNGGCSLRKKKVMLECIEKINWEKIMEYRDSLKRISKIETPNINLKNEDVFFSHACEILHKLVPDKLFRSFFSIESDFNIETANYHGWNKFYISETCAIELLQHSDFFSKYL